MYSAAGQLGHMTRKIGESLDSKLLGLPHCEVLFDFAFVVAKNVRNVNKYKPLRLTECKDNHCFFSSPYSECITNKRNLKSFPIDLK